MAQITVAHLLDMAMEILQDDPTSPEHWTKENLVNWYNLGVREAVAFAPLANAIFEPIKLAAGIRQTIPARRIALIDVIRNMGSDGVTPGEAVTKTDIRALATYDRSWSTSSPASVVRNWAPETLTSFFITPPSDGTNYLEIEVAAVPEQIVYDGGGLWESALVGVAEKYVNAVLNWVLYRAYQKDSDYPGNEPRAKGYYQQFLTACRGGSAQ